MQHLQCVALVILTPWLWFMMTPWSRSWFCPPKSPGNWSSFWNFISRDRLAILCLSLPTFASTLPHPLQSHLTPCSRPSFDLACTSTDHRMSSVNLNGDIPVAATSPINEAPSKSSCATFGSGCLQCWSMSLNNANFFPLTAFSMIHTCAFLLLSHLRDGSGAHSFGMGICLALLAVPYGGARNTSLTAGCLIYGSVRCCSQLAHPIESHWPKILATWLCRPL